MSALQDILTAVTSADDWFGGLEYCKGAHSTGEGDRYEERMLALVFLRCLKHRLRFQLSSNNDDAGKFDDLVLVWRPEGQPGARGLLVQLKHKTSERAKLVHRSTWLSEAPNCDFGLAKYYASYRKISGSLEMEGLALVLLTNARLADSCGGMFVRQAETGVPGAELLRAGGRLYRLDPADEQVRGAVRGDAGFAERFYVLCGQRNSEEIAGDLYEELEELLGAGPLCGRICDRLCKSVREWMNGQSVCLTSGWSAWRALVDEYVRDEVTGCGAATTGLQFGSVEDVRDYVTTCNPAWVRPPDEKTVALTATKIHQALAHETHIVVGMEHFRALRQRIVCCWGPFCRWLVLVDDDNRDNSDIFFELMKQMHTDRRLVIVSMTENSCFIDTCQSSNISDDSWNEKLNIKVRLNGDHYECHLCDLVGDADTLKAVVDGNPALLLALARLSRPLRMGQELEPLPSDYSPTKLVERRLVAPEFFSSVGQQDVCITDSASYRLLLHEIGGHAVLSVADVGSVLTSSETEWPLFVLTDDLNASSIREICRKQTNWNIYVLQFADDGWEILYFRGNPRKIREYVREKEREPLEVLDAARNTVIVEGRPGVGKSTMLSHVGKQLKDRDSACWLLRVNLLDFYTVFDHCDSGTIASEDILQQSVFNKGDQGRLEYALLHHSLLESPRVICLVDGFDEVCPDYADKCLEVLSLLTPRRGKLLVTTRPATVTHLETRMSVLAHTLRPFSDPELQEFFILHSRRRNLPPINGVKKGVRDLLRIPLFARMYVNLSGERAAIYDIVTLYEDFFRNKFRRLYEEKWGDNLSAPGKRKEIEVARKRHEEQLMLLAVSALVHSADEPLGPSFDSDIFVKAGIVYELTGSKPVFLHRTFAEHFLAKWCFVGFGEPSRATVYREAYRDGSLEFFLESFDRRAARGRPLLLAVLDGDEAELGALLAAGADRPGEADECGRGALHLAAAHGAGSSLLLLRLCRRPREGAMSAEDALLRWTPLRYAAEGRRWAAVKALLEAGDDVSHLGDFRAGSQDPALLRSVFDRGGYRALFRHVLRESQGAPVTRWCTAGEGQVSAQIQFAVSLVCANMAEDWLDLITEKAMEEGHVEVHNLLLRANVNTAEEETGDTVANLKAKGDRADQLRNLQDTGQQQKVSTEVAGQELGGIYSPSCAVGVPDGGALSTAQSGADASGCEWTELHNMYLVGNDRGAMLFVDGGTIVQRATVVPGEKCQRLLAESGGRLLCLSAKGDTRGIKLKVVPTEGELEQHPAISSLHYDAAVGNADILHTLINMGTDVNETDEYGNAALHYAATSGSAECISLLLEAGADVQVKTDDGSTALHLASRNGYADSVRLLIRSGSHINGQNSNGDTPLICAAGSGSVECMRVLLDAGADVCVADNRGDTALCTAAGGGNAECVAVSVAAGAEVNVRDSGGYTPVHAAAVLGSVECVKLLTDAGASVRVQDNAGNTPLHFAVAMGNTECVRLLIELGASVREQNCDRATPLHRAAEEGHADCVRLLLDGGSDVKAKNDDGYIPLHFAAGGGHTECVKLLVHGGSDVLAQSADGSTPLHYTALNSGNVDCIRLLLNAGASLATLDGEGGTPLHCAAANGNVECTALLLAAGSDIRARDSDGYTALHFAALNGHAECAAFLLDNGADVLAQTANGDTPLHRAAGRGHADVITVLLRAGAPVGVHNKAGKTAQQVAQEEGNLDCVARLLLQGAQVVEVGDDVHSRGTNCHTRQNHRWLCSLS
ncbi:uncharacterized protein LOC126106275 [Schistocerca cancellata]|uniref:uncharacterized protein LOC126106275 n=1 Tax=Schistocerca cancellata TaxID=274614 RepID=UPI0021179F4A|nr:uncharacterized protein LOC126106275 [Schistocerca cancellata]